MASAFLGEIYVPCILNEIIVQTQYYVTLQMKTSRAA